MRYKAIIFDMDGTIIDSERIWNEATLTLFNRRSIKLDEAEKADLRRKVAGLALHKSCATIKEMGQFTESIEELIEEKSAIACSLYKKNITFIDGFIEFHEQVQQLNLKTGVATNADDQTLAIAKNRLQLDRFFGKHLYGISAVGNRCKPDPAIYLHAAEQLQVDPRECLAIEDSYYGIKAAQAAGIYCIGINSANDRTQLVNANQIIDHYNQIDLLALIS